MPLKLVAALGLTVLATGAALSQTRELDAHQHGHGALNIAVEGGAVAMELVAPGADIVGFEHPAKSDEDRAAIEAAIAMLAKPLDLFVFPAGAGCTVAAANVTLVGEEDHDEDHARDEHDHDEDHAEHKDDHDHKDDHSDQHADEHSGEGHTEFHAEYALTCTDPGALTRIDFAYFARFPNAVELDIQMISDTGAKGFEVERDDPKLNL